ncbi:MAG TPA: amylo-alpha-1,6-glucosidase [Bryobacteraceae bacterium]|jgi:predicted glycogen debranching enzyme
MNYPIRSIKGFNADRPPDPHLDREWLVTNGLGGYASGTVAGPLTRRYHGILIAALPNPLGRYMMLNAVCERMKLPDHGEYFVGPRELANATADAHLIAEEFRLEAGLPVWTFHTSGWTVEKRLHLPHAQNTVQLSYELLAGSAALQLELHFWVNFRHHDAPVSTKPSEHFALTAQEHGYELTGDPDQPVLRIAMPGGNLSFQRRMVTDLLYETEERRGYDSLGALFIPGCFDANLSPGERVTFTASVENWNTMLALSPPDVNRFSLQRRQALLQLAEPALHEDIGAELVLAADQFVIKPAGRCEDQVRAIAAGDEFRTVIAGYHWFTDWGRDTMISLEGLTLRTGRFTEAGWILRNFANYVKDGLIPNLFPEGEEEGLYHTADASLWFFHAVSRYLAFTGDQLTLQLILPVLEEIAQAHLQGTRFGIHVDPADGLLHQGAEGYQLTWMDAKVGDWVVTPRRGKAVEINALWYNALCCLAGWMNQVHGRGAGDLYQHSAEKARECFNRRFWCEERGYLYDVVDGENGNDISCRPNQIFAFSLPNPVLDPSHWESVMDVVTRELLTPVGLRSLSTSNPEYKSRYDGDLRARDAAYHQGSVWAWLIGPYIDAWLKLHPGQNAEARQFLSAFAPHLSEACIGSISEIFDGEKPHIPRACIAQAWSVAEVLRSWANTA